VGLNYPEHARERLGQDAKASDQDGRVPSGCMKIFKWVPFAAEVNHLDNVSIDHKWGCLKLFKD
jgi:hypothetical protein